MIRTLTIIALLMGQTLANDALSESKVLAPEDLNIKKWVFEQETDLETVAVMKIEHTIAGIAVDVYEEVFYSPDRSILGSLLIFNEHRPVTIKLPTSNTIRLQVDERWRFLGASRGKITSVDGKARDCQKVEIKCARESVVISFYSAPMSIFRKELPDMPDPASDSTSSFTWRHKIVDVPFWVSKESKNGKEVVTLHRKGEQDVTVQPATCPESKPEGDPKLQSESEGCSQ